MDPSLSQPSFQAASDRHTKNNISLKEKGSPFTTSQRVQHRTKLTDQLLKRSRFSLVKANHAEQRAGKVPEEGLRCPTQMADPRQFSPPVRLPRSAPPQSCRSARQPCCCSRFCSLSLCSPIRSRCCSVTKNKELCRSKAAINNNLQRMQISK